MKGLFFLQFLLALVLSANAQETIQQTLSIKGNGVNSTEILLYKQDNVTYYDIAANHGGLGIANSTTNAYTLFIHANDNVGIGTTAPSQKLDVNGNAMIRGGLISSVADNNIGGSIQINNPAKTASGAASSWQIFNMTGSYGNSLQFWAYDNLGCTVANGLCSNRFTLMDNGNVGIGTATPNSKLAVNGNIRAHEIKVETANWPDYVFARDYQLPTLQETEKHIKEKGHLPGIPSAEEVKSNGIDLGEMNAKLLQKIEELTLHLIEQSKLIDNQNQKLIIQEKANLANKVDFELQQKQIDQLRLQLKRVKTNFK